MEIMLPWVGLGALLGLAFVLYLRSVDSRKHYTCPQCGEKQRVELMKATRCSSCGAPLSED